MAARRTSTPDKFDVCIVGGGPAGLIAGIACAHFGFSTALLTGPATPLDGRTTALLAPSITMLTQIGLWPALQPHAAPLKSMRIIDDTGRLIRAPETVFRAGELDLEAFGYNVCNTDINAELSSIADDLTDLTIFRETAKSVDFDNGAVLIGSDKRRRIIADLVVGSDGRNSMVRTAAGITTRSWAYDQVAVVCNLTHAGQNNDTSTEFHTPSGPFTLVPLPQSPHHSSLVCVVRQDVAEQMLAMDDDALCQEFERRAHSVLGAMKLETPPQAFPLGCQLATEFSGPQVALVGEAAHVFPPIGAQGLNLGIRDVAALVEALVDARKAGQSIGGTTAMVTYNKARNVDVWSRTAAVDLLNRTLLSDLLPVQLARGFGLYVAGRISGVRKLLMRESLAPVLSGPRLTRGLPLG